MKTVQEIAESKAAAVEMGLDALETLQGCLPVATPEDLDATATALVLQAAQLRACARAQREMVERERARVSAMWWAESGAAG